MTSPLCLSQAHGCHQRKDAQGLSARASPGWGVISWRGACAILGGCGRSLEPDSVCSVVVFVCFFARIYMDGPMPNPEALTNTLFELNPTPTLIHDRDDVLSLRVNEAFTDLMGYTQGDAAAGFDLWCDAAGRSAYHEEMNARGCVRG